MRPVAPALPHGRIATLAEVREQIAYDLTTTGVPRRRGRVVATSEREAAILGAVEFGCDLERVVILQSFYSLQSTGVA